MNFVVGGRRKTAPLHVAKGAREKLNATERTLAALDEANAILDRLETFPDGVCRKARRKLEETLCEARQAQAFRLRTLIVEKEFNGLDAANDP